MKKIKSYLLTFLVLPLILLSLVEIIQRADLLSFAAWPFTRTGEFTVSFLLFVAILCIGAAILRELKLAFFVSLIITSLFALVSSLKQMFLKEPLLPWDFVLGKETTDIVNYFTDFINAQVVFYLVAIILLGVFLFRFWGKKVYRYSWLERILFIFLACLILSSICLNRPLALKRTFDLECVTWDQKLNAQQNGLLLSFCLNLQWLSVQEPEGYQPEKIREIIEDYNEQPAWSNPGIKPNIIIIMNEAFWDPCLLPGVSFSRDPLPFFRALQKEHSGGTLMVPVFGGATVNTEFEVLTGNSTQFLPGGSIAYAQYVRQPVESLASVLAGQGYYTAAIHSYHNWFYRRNEVFRNLGFSKFISSEFFVNPQIERYCYIADHEVSDLIIEEVQASRDPSFIFAVTMQNHGPYGFGYEKGSEIKVSGDLSDDGKYYLEVYAQGLLDADRALRMLVEHFEKDTQPTIIVFFGDHLPFLGENYQVYREVGYYQEDGSYEEYRKMYSVPLLFWSNYLTEQEEINLNASYLGAYLLQRAGLKGSPYFQFLQAKAEEVPLIPNRAFCQKAAIDPRVFRDYQLLQYDLLFGEKYLYQGESPPIVQTDYFLGRGQMIIEDLQFKDGFLEVKGANFVPDCQIYLKNKALETNFISERKLTAFIPEKKRRQLAELPVQVKLTDSLRNLLAESNCTILAKMLK